MRTVREVSRISGVSVRTLHHYDAIGLLKPTAVTDAGYRLYNDDALRRLQTILLFRELQFPLKDIKAMLDAPNYDAAAALDMQIKLLTMQKEHIEQLLCLARTYKEQGGIPMKPTDFQAFDKSKQEQYAAEVKARWGNTDAYHEFESKTAGQTDAQAQENGEGLMRIFAEFGTIRTESPDSPAAQTLVRRLQAYITAHYYNCTDEILRGLSELYAAEGEFKENIDRAGGVGTADFAAAAIKASR